MGMEGRDLEQADKRLIFHVDVNSAFLSWEATRRVSMGMEDLRLIPSCVGGDPSRRTSIVLAKSIPAKKYQITTGESMMTAMKKCPNLVVAEPDFHLYKRCSKAFKDICRQYAPVVEEFSIDECFLDMTGTSLLYPDPIRTAYEIKDTIKEQLGFTVNVGVGPNKLLAKMAGDFEKPDKVHTLFYEEVKTKMWPLKVEDLLFCGSATATRLNQIGITTIGQLANCDLEYLKSVFGEKNAIGLHNNANGIDFSQVREEREEAKGFSVSTTTEDDIVGFERGNQILLALADSLCMHVRRENKLVYGVSVHIRYTDFKNRSHQRKLSNPSDITNEIYAASKELLKELWDGKTPLRLMGIALSDVTEEEYVQMSFFDANNEKGEKTQKADRAIDEIRKRFGRDSIQRGAALGASGRIARKERAEGEL